jgi:hypothetical protein
VPLGVALGWNVSVDIIAGIAVILLIGAMRVLFARRHRRTLPDIAAIVERRTPVSKNVLMTAAELASAPRKSTAVHVIERIHRDAAGVVRKLDYSSLIPIRRAAGSLAAGSLAWIAMVVLAARTGDLRAPSTAAEAATIGEITVVVVPPAYAALDSVVLRNPDRIEALAGSRLRISVVAAAALVELEMLARTTSLSLSQSGAFTGEVVADEDGFIGVRATGSTVGAGTMNVATRLIGLSVTPDNLPRTRVTVPGRDLLVPDARRTISLTVEADDDIALASLQLKYTKVSGSGEQFAFTDGEVPLGITRTSATNWTATGSWDISSLSLVPGDMVIYRAVASDGRPNAPVADSDTYILEIAGPGALLSGGFSIDDEFDRYAVSQQMVILKSERLFARKASTDSGAFALESLDLAAEQRKVRAEFIFMMGGELADEVEAELAGLGDLNEHAHAALDDEAISGRLAHEGRLDLIRAIRSMSHASAALTGAQLDSALTHEGLALEYLQRAFARTRYILRTLTERERLDPARRLTGVLATAARDVAPARRAESDSAAVALRALLADVATLAAQVAARGESESAGIAGGLALRVLRIDPGAVELQEISSALNAAAAAIRGARSAEALALVGGAATSLAEALRTKVYAAPLVAGTAESRRLEGALADALRRVIER